MVTVITFYRFVTIDKPAHLQVELRSLLKSLSIRGTVIVATEGINGTIAGNDGAMVRFRDWLERDPRVP